MSFKLKQALSLSQEEDCRTLDNEGQESRSSRDVDRGVGRTGTNYGTYIAINEYSKRMEDELDMMPGDKIEVITDDQEYNDGWYYGRNLRTGQEGLYPRLFTQEISVDQPSPAVMRAKSTNRPDSPLSDKEAVNSQLDRPNFIDAGAGGELSDYGAGGRVSGKTTNTAQQNSKNISVKSTMSDIDRALEELRGESLNAMNVSSDLAQQSGNFSAFSSANDSSTINRLNEDSIDVLDAYNWTPEQVTAYMIATGFDEESASKFQQHKVSGNILLELELAHLKELEINSFGTRFEMFKEIEALKEMIMRSQFSTNSASNVKIPSSADDDSPALSNQDTLENLGAKARSYGDRSRSNDSTPVLRQMTSTPRLRSSVLSVYETSPVGDSFMSPRKAPVPPPYPSPVQPPKSPNVVGKPKFAPATFHSQSQPRYPHPTIYEQQLKEAKPPSPYNATNHRRSSSSGKNHLTGYFENPELPNPYMAPSPIITEAKNDMSEKPASSGHSNNSNSANRHKKSKSGGSFIELFNRISMLSSPNDYDLFTYPDELTVPSTGGRPTSSIYGHSKTASGNQNLRPPAVDKESKKHRRNSSILSFLHRDKDLPSQSHEIPRNGSLVNLRPDSASADEIKYHPPRFTDVSTQKFPVNNDKPEISSTVQAQSASVIQDNKDLAAHPNSQYMTDEQRRSVSAKEHHAPTAVFYDNRDESSSNNSGPSDKNNKNSKRSISDAVKSMRRLNTTKGVPKKQTSAFTEGIRSVTVGESIKDASCSGWMSKKGAGAMGVWKNRFFTLHGTRLSYFSNTHDTRERGLIDITSHRVLPAKEDDKFVALYAASVGKGRYCFKLVPPAPGSRKGLTFTQPRVHYFAVDSKEEMRTWMAALMKATIDIDPTVPVISSCATPTVSLSRAQEMFSQALEETYKRDENMLKQEDSEELYWEQHHNKVEGYDTLNGSGSVNSSQNHSNNNAAAVHGVESPYTDFDSPAGSSSTTKNPQNYRFSFESPAVNSGVGEYFRLDPKFLPDKI